jgi:hypothetical protein
MKVKELIEKLQALDPEHMVVVDGYEGGVGELKEISTVCLSLNVNDAWYYGEHELCDESTADPESNTYAVLLPRSGE